MSIENVNSKKYQITRIDFVSIKFKDKENALLIQILIKQAGPRG